ncbi:hypothetical protein A3K63_00640 [Candidatus Micrarchaeota archaeon RBG_16_49_10]|nr:MAG: hypothetical protein A3K63_00640 [Candidatus Micrarchaeota archaeon RBG_16_49_10]
MRVLLINPPSKFNISKDSRWPEHTKSGTLYYPFWLAYTAGVLLEAKKEVMLIDSIAKRDTFESALEKVKRFSPNLLVATTTTGTLYADIKFLESVKKELKKCKTVLAGSHVTALPEETLKISNSIDFITRGEFEYTVFELSEALEGQKNFESIKGLSYRKGGKIINNPGREPITCLDKIPFVSKVYKKFLNPQDYRYALALHPMTQIWTSRGCPNMCNFCVYPHQFTLKDFRVRSPKNVVDEVEWISKNLPEIKEFFFEDDTFTIDQERVHRICEEIQRRRLKVTWSCNVRVSTSYETLRRMKEAGCRIVIVGYESGDQNVLNTIKKGTTLKQAEEFTRNAKKVGLKIFGCFMIGLQGDDKVSVEKTFNFAKKINPDMVFFQQAVPFPGTAFYNWVKEMGYLNAKDWDEWIDDNGQLRCLVDYPDLPAAEIKKLRDSFMLRFYLSPKHAFQLLRNNINSASEIARIMTYSKEYLLYLLKSRKSK